MKKIIMTIMAIVMGVGLLVPTPVFAADNAAILTDCADAEENGGEGIKCVINLVVQILSVGVGVFGAIGIAVVGIQYLTAGGNEEQTRKAKRRLFEIIIGLAFYAVAAALLNWLLPGFAGYSSDDNSTGSIQIAQDINVG